MGRWLAIKQHAIRCFYLPAARENRWTSLCHFVWRHEKMQEAAGIDWVCLADEARCGEDDARDERSLAAIQQHFFKHMGHNSLHSGTP